MAFDKRIYHKGEQVPNAFKQKVGMDAANRYFYLRMGVVTDVDYDKYEMSIQWLKKDGAHTQVPISFPYIGPAGCIGMVPEKGSIGIFGFLKEGDSDKGRPLCLAFLPPGLGTMINHDVLKILPDVIPTDDLNEIQHKFRKIGPKEICITSADGGTVFVSPNLELYDQNKDTIYLRAEDQTILTTSVNNFMFADGASISAGPVMRNSLIILDANGNKIPFLNGSPMHYPSGRDNIYFTPHGSDIKYDSQFYTEFRIDVDEMSDGRLDINDINSESPVLTRDPIVTLVLGNYIGSDKKDLQRYGYILKPNLFSSETDQEGEFSLNWAVQNNGVDEPSLLGLAYALNFLKSGTFMGVDKEGHYYMHLARSIANPLGAGRSMSILADGNLKEVWGLANSDGNSWDFAAKGGIRWNVGAHNEKGNGRSIQITTTRGYYLEVEGGDDDGVAKTEIIGGPSVETVVGIKSEDYNSQSLIIRGMKTETIEGSSTENYLVDKSLNVTGVFNENVIKEKQCNFGKRKTTIKGNDELTVVQGDIKETILTFGKKSTTVTTGDIEETIVAGSRKTTIQVGDYSVNLTAGTIGIKTAAGFVTISGTTVTLEGSLYASIKAPIVRIGNGAPIGGAITGLPGIPSHFDYTVGVPLVGSKTVSIAP